MIRTIAIIFSLVFPFTTIAQSPWQVSDDSKADVYPSEQAAVEAMIDSFAKSLRNQGGFDENNGHILIEPAHGNQLTISSQNVVGSAGMSSSAGMISSIVGPDVMETSMQLALRLAHARLQRALPRITIVDALPANATIDVSLAEVEHVQTPISNGYTGRLVGLLDHAGIKSSFETRFVDKPWVDDWARFVTIQPNGTWIVGRSDRVAVTQSQAEYDARNDAAKQLVPLVRARMGATFTSISSDEIRRVMANELQTNFAADRFVQRVDKPYGPIWRATVLVPSSDNVILPFVSTFSVQESHVQNEFKALLVMAGVIFVLYLFLNAVTKGYFTWQLRGIVLIALIIGALLMMFFMARVSMHVSVPAPARVTVQRSVTIN